mmetsp:Transcript_18438/g.27855  ORF Transcript_18438/g.27855 Transcript_18438/m.27855 type:complete len:241 (+) Transcript_18438:67-789(+)
MAIQFMVVTIIWILQLLLLEQHVSTAFLTTLQSQSSMTTTKLSRTKLYLVEPNKGPPNLWKSIGNLWEEIIEMSTYGPSERRILKARREAAAAACSDAEDESDGDWSIQTFQQRKRQQQQQQQPNQKSTQTATTDFDGYALRDLLIDKWGVPLDIDFQRGPNAQVYCTILPVAFGSRKCRHFQELDYLMHLQGVVEILEKYHQLELFLSFIETTNKKPKAGTDSVPFRLDLSREEMETIL